MNARPRLEPVMALRSEAARHAVSVLRDIDFDREDVLIVADWIVTGRADLAKELTEHTASLYSDDRKIYWVKGVTPDQVGEVS